MHVVLRLVGRVPKFSGVVRGGQLWGLCSAEEFRKGTGVILPARCGLWNLCRNVPDACESIGATWHISDHRSIGWHIAYLADQAGWWS